jgi:hypothetical protein
MVGNVVTVVAVAAMIAGAVEAHAWLARPASAPSFIRPLLPKHPNGALQAAGGGPVSIPGTPAADGDYRFLRVNAKTGMPIRFDPCQTVEYIVNPTGAPQGALSAVNAAVAEVSKATGIEFRSVGLTSEKPSVSRGNYLPYQYGNKWVPILIAWMPLGKPSGTGHGFGAVGGPGGEVPDGNTSVYVSGGVTMNTDANLAPEDYKPVLMHELGHVMGLDHAARPGEVMYPDGGVTAAWGPGDLKGLAQIGRAAGCLPEPKPGG